MENASLVVKLIDQITAPARAAAKALASVRAAEQAVTQASKVTQAAVSAVGAATATAGARAAAAATGFDKAARSMQRLSLASVAAHRVAKGNASWNAINRKTIGFRTGQRQDLGAQGLSAWIGAGQRANVGAGAQGAGSIIAGGFKDLMRWNTAAGEGISKWQDLSAAFMRTPFGFVLGGLGKVGGVIFDIIGSLASALLTVGKLTLALGALAAIGFTKMVVEMGAFADRSKRALAYITGSDALGRKEFASAVQLSKDLGTNLEETVDHYAKLRSMQFTAGESAGLVRLSNDLKAITGDSQAAERALRAMTQIKAKGRLQSEELVGQLAEAGVSTTLVYEQLERMLGTDRKGVLKQLQGGAIDANTGLVAIVNALKTKYHISEVGTIGENFAENTLTGIWDSIKNAGQRMFMRIGERINTKPLIEGLQLFKETLDGAFEGRGAVDFVNRMLEGVGKLIPLVLSFAEGFGSGLDAIAKALTFGEAGNVKEWAFGAGKGVATFFARVIDVTKEAVPAIGKAISALFEGVDVNRVIAGLKSFDWKAFGDNLATIASSLGSIMGSMAPALKGVSATSAVAAAKDPGSILSPDSYTGFGGRAKHLWDTLWNDESWSDAAKNVPRGEPRIGADAMRPNMSNRFESHYHLDGEVGEETKQRLRDAVESGNVSFIRRLLDGEVAEAT